MDVQEELRALRPEIDDVQKDIKSTVGQLFAVVAEINAGNLDENRLTFLMDEWRRLGVREEQLRAEKLLLLKKEEFMRSRLPVPQQRGESPSHLKKKKIGFD